MTDYRDAAMNPITNKSGRKEQNNLEFCPSCKKILLPNLEKRRLRCSCCGYERPLMETKLYSEGVLKPKKTLVLKDTSRHRIRKKLCPRCGNDEAYSWMHGRSKENAPEPSNRFFKCTKCGHSWKEM